MSGHNTVEKRRHPRVDNNVPLKICAPEVDLVTETRNISCSGAYCRVNHFLEPMTKLQLTLLLPVKKGAKAGTKKVTCGGVVVRTENIPHEEGFNTAIFFNDIHPKDSRLLADHVERVLEAKGGAPSKARR